MTARLGPRAVPPPARMGLWWQTVRLFLRCLFVLAFRGRVYGAGRVPHHGPVILACNHQNFLDPTFLSVGLLREMAGMCKDSLFRNRWAGRFLRSLNMFPVKQRSADLGSFKECLRRLRAGRLLLLFPEGTRSATGRLAPFLPGLGALAKRSRAVVVPVLIEGAYEAWPRHRLLPRTGWVEVYFDDAIPPEAMTDLSPAQIAALVRERILAMRHARLDRLDRRTREKNAAQALTPVAEPVQCRRW